MTCEEVDRDELIEQYVLGRLDAARQEAFEDHYFACSNCLERLRIIEETRGELASQTVAARPRAWRRAAAGLAAAAVVVLALRVGQQAWLTRDTGAPPALPARDTSLPAPTPAPAPSGPTTGTLGAIALPPYAPPRLRATPTDAQRIFQEGMVPYAAGNCAAAIPSLQRATALDDSLMPARFYLAACELHEGRVDTAAEKLQRIIAAGESPYLEDAHFFLAKARIRQNDLPAARAELARVIALRGDRRAEAARLLDALR